MFGKRYVELLEQELREWKIRFAEQQKKLDAMTNTVFAVQGAPPPFADDNPVEAGPPRKTDQQFLAELEAAAAATIDADAVDRLADN